MKGECKFLKKEVTLGIEHEFCKNPQLIKTNKCKESKGVVATCNRCNLFEECDEDSCDLSAQNSLGN